MRVWVRTALQRNRYPYFFITGTDSDLLIIARISGWQKTAIHARLFKVWTTPSHTPCELRLSA